MGETSPLFVCRKESYMKEYEVLIETINPCGGEKHADKKLIEVATEDPGTYVRENSPYPVRCAGMDKQGNIVIGTGNEQGYQINYTFTEA